MLYHCFASFKQSPLYFFKLVDSRLILTLLCDSGVHQSHLSCWGNRFEKVKLRGLDYVAHKMCHCAVLLKDKIVIRSVFGSYCYFVEMVEHLINAIQDIQFMLDEEKLPFLTWHRSNLTPQQI